MKRLLYALLAIVSTIIILFAIGFSLRLFVPAIHDRTDNITQKESSSEILTLLKCLYKYADNSKHNKFPDSLAKLNCYGIEEGWGPDKIKELSERYWYLPDVANETRDFNTPILIEKPNHYKHIEGGYIAFSGFDIRWYKNNEYQKFIHKYVKNGSVPPIK